MNDERSKRESQEGSAAAEEPAAAAGEGQAEAQGPGEAGGEPREGEALPPAEELMGLLEDARSKADEHWNEYLRAQAELENMRKRFQRDMENARKYALERFVQELLPVKDSLEMGLAAAGGDKPDVEKLREGLELTLKMLADVMAKFGVREVDPRGQPFDPALHQAVSTQETTAQPPNTVVAVMQKGYLLNDRLVRPAMVVVAKAPSDEEKPEQTVGGNIDEQA